jgi:antitoxin (DNA-binding transcriptional repressor) of toxin-antitoxin stability system
MKQIGAAKFKEHCLAILDEIDDEGIVITKRGKPVAKLAQMGRIAVDLDEAAVRRVLSRVQLWPVTLEVALSRARDSTCKAIPPTS